MKVLKLITILLIILSIASITIGVVCYVNNVDNCRFYISSWDNEVTHWSVMDNMCDPFSFIAGMLWDLGLILFLISVILGFIYIINSPTTTEYQTKNFYSFEEIYYSRNTYTLSTPWAFFCSNYKPKLTLYNFGICFPSMFFVILGIAMFIASFTGESWMIWGGLTLIVLGALFTWLFLGIKMKILAEYKKFMEDVKVKEEQYNREHPHPQEEKFFKELRDSGISDLDSKANIARMLRFVENKRIKATEKELIEKFNIGKYDVEFRETNERLKEIRAQEKKLYDQYTYYARFSMQEKSIAICADKIKEAEEIIRQCERDEESVKRGGEATYLLGRQQESSWAVHGGIANGIAGGMAGLAVAVDVERRNQEARQQNAQLGQSIAALSVMQLEKIWKIKGQAKSDKEYWKAKLEEATLLLAEKVDPKKLLDMMNPTVKSFDITETGSVKVEIGLQATDLIILDEVKAVVDGSIDVLLKVDDETVGSAICVLPYGGTSIRTTVKGIFLNPSKVAQNYTFEFAPHDLWAIETK